MPVESAVPFVMSMPPFHAQAAHTSSGARTGLVLMDAQRKPRELQARDPEVVALEGKGPACGGRPGLAGLFLYFLDILSCN